VSSVDRVAESWTRALGLVIDRTVECFELVDEVKALDEEVERLEKELDLVSGGWAVRVAYRNELLDEIKALKDVVAQRDAEIEVVREQLALEISRRCLGGTPPASTPLWANKFAGQPPPAHPFTKDSA